MLSSRHFTIDGRHRTLVEEARGVAEVFVAALIVALGGVALLAIF